MNNPAPASEPTIRAESDVVRDAPIAAVNRSIGIVSATSALRIARSDDRIRPEQSATTNTGVGLSRPLSPKVISVAASSA